MSPRRFGHPQAIRHRIRCKFAPSWLPAAPSFKASSTACRRYRIPWPPRLRHPLSTSFNAFRRLDPFMLMAFPNTLTAPYVTLNLDKCKYYSVTISMVGRDFPVGFFIWRIAMNITITHHPGAHLRQQSAPLPIFYDPHQVASTPPPASVRRQPSLRWLSKAGGSSASPRHPHLRTADPRPDQAGT